MKILEWMQKRLNGNNGKKKPSSISATHYMIHEPCKQEFGDWPQALLAIGTFGTNNVKEDSDRTKTTAEDPPSLHDCALEFTLEEVGNLQNELNTYFPGLAESNLAAEQEENPNDLIDKRLNSEHSSLEENEGKENETFSDGSSINRVNFYPSSSLMYSRGKDRCLDNSKSAVGKKSLYFLLKKMFVCKSGFEPTPFLKDPLSTESRMEKILRAIINRKIYPQGPSSTMFINKYLETKPISQSVDDDDDEEKEFTNATGNGIKWVKTDAEYIVLEI